MTRDQILGSTPEERLAEFQRLVTERDAANDHLAWLQEEQFQEGLGNPKEINEAAVAASNARKAVTAYVQQLCTLIGGASV